MPESGSVTIFTQDKQFPRCIVFRWVEDNQVEWIKDVDIFIVNK